MKQTKKLFRRSALLAPALIFALLCVLTLAGCKKNNDRSNSPSVNTATASIPTYYIHTSQDRAITIALQNQMVATAGIKNIYTINISHSPHLSMPDQVTSILLHIIK